MEGTSSLSVTSSIIFNPLKNDVNIAALNAFEEIIRTCIGPCGKLKVVQNISGGQVTASSSSQRLLNIISIKNTLLKLIVSSAKAHLNIYGDGGLVCILLILKLIKHSLTSLYPLPLIGKLIEHFGKLFIDSLNAESNACVIRMDFSNLMCFKSIVETMLQSKPGCILSKDDVKHLSILLMKVHFDAIPITIPVMYHRNIDFATLEGTHVKKSQLFDGLLIRLPEIPVKNAFNFNTDADLQIVLLTISLSGDAEFPVDKIEVDHGISVWESVLNYLRDFVAKIIELHVHILACQKVVHPSLRKQLEDADILVLDRLGSEVSKKLQYLTGSSNSSLFSELSIGSITGISIQTIGVRKFLLLKNNLKPFWTMLICNFNEQAVNETKVVCQQVIDTLFRLLKKPDVCYGAGCTEIYTSQLVQEKVITNIDELKQDYGCNSSQILETLQIFLQSITDIAVAINQGSKLNFVTETTYYHLWKLQNDNFPSQSDRCLCGQIIADCVTDSSWSFLDQNLSEFVLSNRCPRDEVVNNVNQSMILDELSSKVNAYSVAFETASLLLRTSLCIHS